MPSHCSADVVALFHFVCACGCRTAKYPVRWLSSSVQLGASGLHIGCTSSETVGCYAVPHASALKVCGEFWEGMRRLGCQPRHAVLAAHAPAAGAVHGEYE